jgi:hypothetical protein
VSADPVRFDHPANARILAYLGDPERLRTSVSAAKDRPSCSPGEIAEVSTSLGAHPDLLERLWDQLGASLPADCRRVVHGTPVLVHRRSGVLFAFGGGTSTYALRLPAPERAEALRSGAKTVREYPAHPALGVEPSRLDLATIGPEWVFGDWREDEIRWCRAAFDAAGTETG